jgi:uncharacterized membrane protein
MRVCHVSRLVFFLLAAILLTTMYKILIPLTGLASLTACTSIPLEQRAPIVAGGSAQITQGRALYVGKCTKCHTAEPIHNYTMAQLTGDIIPEMSEKAHLTPQDHSALMAYVTAARSLPAPVAKQ